MSTHRLTHPEIWASSAGYHVHYSHTLPKTPSFEFAKTDVPAIDNAAGMHLEHLQRSPLVIEAVDVTVIQWHWNRQTHDSRYTYFFCSRTGDFLVSEPEQSSIWLKYFPIFEMQSPESIKLKIDLKEFVIEIPQDNFGLFCGGELHFGHWMADTLYKFTLSDHFPVTKRPYVCNRLTPYYLSALKYLMTGEMNSIPDIRFLPANLGQLVAFKFKKLFVPAHFPLALRYGLVRNWLDRKIKLPSQKWKGLYLGRGTINDSNRIKNETEVIETVLRRGYMAVYPHTLQFEEAHILFSASKVFLVPHGSASTNFFLFGGNSSKMVYIAPNDFELTTAETVCGSAYYLTSALARTKFVRSKGPNSGSKDASGQSEIITPIHELNQILDKTD